VFQNDLDQESHWRGRQDSRGAERQDNKVHHNKDAESIQERANDDVFPQEGNSVRVEDKNASDDNGYNEFKDQPEQGGTESACINGVTHCAAGYILQ